MAINTSYYGIPSNIERICRICLTENGNLSPIFCNEQQSIDNISDLQEKISVCGAVDIHMQDGLPNLICDVCIYKASVAFEFRQLCQHSDARLRLYYNKPARFNAMDSGTQTEMQTQSFIPKTVILSSDFYTKEAVLGNEQFHTSLVGSQFSIAVDSPSALNTTDNSTNISVSEDKLFDCHLSFQESQHSEHQQPDVSCLEQATTCLEQQPQQIHEIQTSVIIDQVCHIEANNANCADITSKVDNYFQTTQSQSKVISPLANTQIENNDSSSVITPIMKNIKESQYYESSIEDNKSNIEKCTVNPESYLSEAVLKNHSLDQEKEKKHKCDICTKLFFKYDNLEKHKIMHIKKPHACLTCHASFSKLQNLARHLNISSECNNQDNVDTINISQDIAESLKSEDEYNNDSYDEVATDEFNDVPKLYKCKLCNQFCSTLKNLKRHSLLHGEKKYSCTVCKKWFFRPDTLKKHAEKHGHGLLDNINDDNDLYNDTDEDDAFNKNIENGTDKVVDVKEVSEDENASVEYKCQHCGKIVPTKKGLQRHLANHKPKPQPVSCEICKKECASLARLNIHRKTHDKPKEKVPREYLCHMCSKVYPSNSSLTYHMRTHTGIKPHVCKICNSGFTTTTSLANHTRIHTGDKPYVCHVCSAAFAVSSAFRRHLTRHTGEANYICKTCGKAFKRLSTLKEHTYTHSGEKPYVCKSCGAAYSHSGSLFAHQKRCRAQCNAENNILLDEQSVKDNSLASNQNHINNVQTTARSLAVIGELF